MNITQQGDAPIINYQELADKMANEHMQALLDDVTSFLPYETRSRMEEDSGKRFTESVQGCAYDMLVRGNAIPVLPNESNCPVVTATYVALTLVGRELFSRHMYTISSAECRNIGMLMTSANALQLGTSGLDLSTLATVLEAKKIYYQKEQQILGDLKATKETVDQFREIQSAIGSVLSIIDMMRGSKN